MMMMMHENMLQIGTDIGWRPAATFVLTSVSMLSHLTYHNRHSDMRIQLERLSSDAEHNLLAAAKLLS